MVSKTSNTWGVVKSGREGAALPGGSCLAPSIEIGVRHRLGHGVLISILSSLLSSSLPHLPLVGVIECQDRHLLEEFVEKLLHSFPVLGTTIEFIYLVHIIGRGLPRKHLPPLAPG